MIAKIARIIGIIIVSIIALNVVLYIVFSIPSVQQRAANFALSKLQPQLDTEIGLSSIRIRLFNSVELRGFFVKDQQHETLLYIDRLSAQISARDLLRNNLSVHRVQMENFVANVYRDTPDEPFNFQFIIDAFSSEQDTAVVQQQQPSAWHITINDLMLRNGTLRKNVRSEPTTPGEFNTDHIEIYDFNFRTRVDFRNAEDFRFDILLISFLENNSGVHLHDFNGRVLGMGSLLSSEAIDINVNNSYLTLSDVRFNTESQEFAFSLESEVDLQDLNRFVPRFSHMEYPVSLSLDAQGQLPQVSVTNLNLAYNNTIIDLSASLADIRDAEFSDMSVDISNLFVSQEDLQTFIRIGREDFESPEPLWALGDVHLQLQAHGSFNRFQYEGDIQIEQGDVHIAGIGRFQFGLDLISFEGPVSVKYIEVAGIIGDSPGVGLSTVHINAKTLIPRGDYDPVTITAEGHIAKAYFNNYRYEDIFFTSEIVAGGEGGAFILANVHTDTEPNHFDLNANLAFDDNMKFVIDGTVERLDLRPFLMRDGWKTPSVSTQIDIDMRGETMDNMVGTITLLNTSLSDHNFIYNPGPIVLQSTNLDGGGQRMRLMTMFLEATIEGNYYFSTIGNELMYVLRPYLPSVITAEQARLQTAAPQNNFTFNIALRNTEDFSHALVLPFYNVELANISGRLNTVAVEPITLNAHLPRLMFNGNDIRETRLNFRCTSPDGINFDLNTYLSRERGFINVRLNTAAANDSINNLLAFNLNSPVTMSNGELHVSTAFLRTLQNELISTTHIYPASISFNDTRIDINEATIVQRPERVEVTNFGLRENDMLLFGIEGVASTSATDSIRLFFQNTELFNILSAFNIHTISGAINGGVYINQALHNPMIRTEDLRIDNIAVHNDIIGTLIVHGNWNSTDLGLDLDAYLIDGEHRNLTIRGFIPTTEESPYRMGVNVRIEEFGLSTILPFAEDIFSELSGSLSSNLNITGELAEPIIEGWVGIEDGVIRIAYTNVTYYISDRIEIRRDNVGLNDLVIRDQNGNTATLNFALTHANFGRMMYSANIVLDDFLLLNNERRTDLLAHGNLRLSGNLTITGSSSGIFGEGSLQPSSRSNVNVTIPTIATADEFSNVIFINQSPLPDTPEFLWRYTDNRAGTRANNIPVVMQVQLHINPLLEAGVILDPVMGNALRNVRGNGELDFRFDSRANIPVTIFGDYVIQDGTFHLNLRNLRNLNFDIRQGGTITMVGNPLNTRFNIVAYHQVRTDLQTLHPGAFQDMANTRVRANATLEITGDVQSMNLLPSIELPDAPSDIQQRVNSLLDNENSLQQFVHLAAFGSFFPADGALNLSGANVGMQIAANALSQTLDGIFSDNWRIGTTFQSTDGSLDNVRVGVDVSGRLFNDRLHISTNLSYAEESILANHQAFMGEVEVEYEINPWLRLRVYNRSNDRIYRRSPITQGVGVVVTRQARTFENLFRFRGRRNEE